MTEEMKLGDIICMKDHTGSWVGVVSKCYNMPSGVLVDVEDASGGRHATVHADRFSLKNGKWWDK